MNAIAGFGNNEWVDAHSCGLVTWLGDGGKKKNRFHRGTGQRHRMELRKRKV